jgi:excinuclease ABC subunit A
MKRNVDELSPKEYIIIKGARVHNLKNIDVAIRRNSFTVITGLSGSGKSSLAFDTLYAEGQRRYVESLSAYARQFMGKLEKPEVDYIKGISPAVAIEQKVTTRNPRSTVGTSTEIYDYLKLLFARIGKTYSPLSGELVKRHSVGDVVDFVTGLPPSYRVMVTCPISFRNNQTPEQTFNLLMQQGFTRALIDGNPWQLEQLLLENNDKLKFENAFLLVDRFGMESLADEDFLSRLADSIQTAFSEGQGSCHILVLEEDGSKREHLFSSRFEADGMEFEEPSVNFFSFNNPYGACKRCEGFGSIIGIDENLVIPDKSRSVYDDAVACWKGETMGWFKQNFVMNAGKFNFPIHKPYYELNSEQKDQLWNGVGTVWGIQQFFKDIEAQTYKIQYRVMLARFRGKTTCPECRGTRLRGDANHVKVGGKSISDLLLLPVEDLSSFFKQLNLSEHDQAVGKRLLLEINNRISYLEDVGLGYLTLNRLSNSLSGGESQRINLATVLGSSLVGSMYILDEPSIGLHPRDTERLIKVLNSLKKLGNTVIVVEHDEDIMRASDELIDIGPEAGSFGGELIFQGNHADIAKDKISLTAKYLNGSESINLPGKRRKWKDAIQVFNASDNNLKNVSVKFPLQVMTMVTGVSGSGKSTLVKKVLMTELQNVINAFGEAVPGRIGGDLKRISQVEFVDQNPIGRSSRSNPVTFVKAYDDIRTLFANQKLSTLRGYKPSHFSFNVEGGRCEMCEGEGEVVIEMQFMADIHLPCEACNGKRFKSEVLEVTFNDKSISDILHLTVDEAMDFFKDEKRISEKLKPLADVGLGYVQLGQSSSTLSGGEAQRIKLASFLQKGSGNNPTFFIFDEPTTGLHFHDIKKLLKSFEALLEKGHSLCIIEHNMEMVKSADWVIDLGPEGGEKGGHIVFEGTPEDLVKCKESYTGQHLKPLLQRG